MKKEYTFIYVEKNGSGTLTFSGEVEECEEDSDIENEGREYLKEIVLSPDEWRLDQVQDKGGNAVKI